MNLNEICSGIKANMSSEIENTKDDIKEQIRPFYMILLDFWQIGVKILELVSKIKFLKQQI